MLYVIYISAAGKKEKKEKKEKKKKKMLPNSLYLRHKIYSHTQKIITTKYTLIKKTKDYSDIKFYILL